MAAITEGKSVPLTTADGTPLKTSLRRAQRRNKIRAFFLVVPLLAFLGITFLIPIVDMIFRSVENEIVASTLYRTVPLLQQWDDTTGELPPDEVFGAMVQDVLEGKENKTIGKVGTRLNYEKSGMSSAFRSAPRKMGKIEGAALSRCRHRHQQNLGGCGHLAPDQAGKRPLYPLLLPGRGRHETRPHGLHRAPRRGTPDLR